MLMDGRGGPFGPEILQPQVLGGAHYAKELAHGSCQGCAGGVKRKAKLFSVFPSPRHFQDCLTGFISSNGRVFHRLKLPSLIHPWFDEEAAGYALVPRRLAWAPVPGSRLQVKQWCKFASAAQQTKIRTHASTVRH